MQLKPVKNRLNVGGTGNPRRELIYCDDVAEAIVQTLEKYEDVKIPLNIGFDEDYTIREISEKIAEITGFTGEILWDTTRVDGQFKKLLDSSRMKNFDISVTKTPLEQRIS